MIFLLTHQKMVFMLAYLPRSFKIFTNMFAFLYLKRNSMEICEKISFPSNFSEK